MEDKEKLKKLESDNQQLTRQVKSFKDELDKLVRENKQELEKIKKALDDSAKFQLKLPLDVQSKKIIVDTIKENIFNIVWNDYFYYFEAFNSTESLSSSISGSSGADYTGLSQPIFRVYTGATSTNSALIGKNIFLHDAFTFDKRQSIRTQFQVSSVTSVDIMFGTGDIRISSIGNGFGFVVDDATLKGVVQRDGVETTVTLKTITASTAYSVEAQLDPEQNKVVFYVDDEELGVINTSPLREGNDTLWQVNIITNSNAAKSIFLQTFEFIQEK